MSLQDIQSSLYRKQGDSQEENKTELDLNEDIFLSGKRVKQKSRPGDTNWQAPRKEMSERKKKMIKIIIIILLSVVLVVGLIWGIIKYRSSAFSVENLVLSWSGPEETLSGDEIEYIFSWKNNNRADLENVFVEFDFPENFILSQNSDFLAGKKINLSDIGGKTEGEINIKGKIYSPKGSFIYLRAKLEYTPENFDKSLQKESQIGIESMSSPLVMETSAPQGTSNGSLVRYEIVYRNEQEETLTNLRMQAQYPQEFVFSSSSPAPSSSNNLWILDDMLPQEERKIIIDGKLSGAVDESKKTYFYLGAFDGEQLIKYNESEVSTKIVSSPLSITQSFNDKLDLTNVKVGEKIKISISFKNEGDVGLRDVVVSEYLESEALDFSSLNFRNGGSYNSESHEITWRAAEYSQLAILEPGEEGVLEFYVDVKSELPIKSKSDKNFYIKSLAKIDSPDVPTPIDMNKIISSNLATIKVSSPVQLETLGYYEDSVFKNSGPIPPKVGEETTYAIHWKLGSFSNDLESAKIEASLPSGIVYSGLASPLNEKITYNVRTNKIVWEVGNVEAGSGKTSDAREVVFKIKVVPSIDQVGKTIELIKDINLFAVDEFTREELNLKFNDKSNEFREDSSLNYEDFKIVN